MKRILSARKTERGVVRRRSPAGGKAARPARAAKVRLMPRGHWNWSIPVPFSQGWSVSGGRLIFVGGQISADKHGRTIGVGDIEVQTRNVFENVKRVLAE